MRIFLAKWRVKRPPCELFIELEASHKLRRFLLGDINVVRSGAHFFSFSFLPKPSKSFVSSWKKTLNPHARHIFLLAQKYRLAMFLFAWGLPNMQKYRKVFAVILRIRSFTAIFPLNSSEIYLLLQMRTVAWWRIMTRNCSHQKLLFTED